ncbi:MAG: UDP-2,3-diacylglucosamine diphosphatase LpxI [Verrucomicrobiota bacterium]
MSQPRILCLIAGKGDYPHQVLREARKCPDQVSRVVVIAFEGETATDWVTEADAVHWLRVGQLGKLLNVLRSEKGECAMMAGQITPSRLYDLRPDLKALLLLAKLKKRNAETLFGAVADAMAEVGVELLPATTFMEDYLATEGHIAGPERKRRILRDIEFGWPIAKQISAMDVGQSIVVKQGTVLAVEGYDGTNVTIERGGQIGKKESSLIKVSKPNQDMRFDVPVIGPDTLLKAAESGVDAIICEAKKTLLLESERLRQIAQEKRITLWGKKDGLDHESKMDNHSNKREKE